MGSGIAHFGRRGKKTPILNFYRTHVHMGSDHWVAMSVRTYNTFFTLVDDPSEDLS